MAFREIFWMVFAVLVLLSLIIPAVRMMFLTQARLMKLKEIEKERGSRAISLIHRQETLAFLGIPFLRFLSIDESEKILRVIRKTSDDTPIDLIIHTPGGLLLAAEQIANALKAHPAKVSVMVPHFAMSGGTLITLAADEIYMDPNAVLGPIDPQISNYPAASIIKAVGQKTTDEVDDKTLIMADIGEKATRQVRQTITRLLEHKLPTEDAHKLAETLSSGQWTHDYPIKVDEAKEMGLPVTVEVPEQVYDLMELYPQGGRRRPSVQHMCPSPRRRKTRQTGGSKGGSWASASWRLALRWCGLPDIS